MDISVSIRWVVILSIVIAAFFWHKSEVKIAVNEYAVSQRLEYTKEFTRLTEANAKTKVELAEKVKAIKDSKDAEIKSINARYDAIITGMQHRPSRQDYRGNITTDTSATESPKGTTGAGLYKEDANFLAGYARDTEKLKVELIQCYKQYDDVRTTVNKFIEKYK
jgi:hypothetical protein